MFSVKGQIVNIRAHVTLPLQPESSQREYANEGTGLFSLECAERMLKG